MRIITKIKEIGFPEAILNDTQRCLDWLKEEQDFDYHDLDGNDPEDLKGTH